jgi:hypothetical protein
MRAPFINALVWRKTTIVKKKGIKFCCGRFLESVNEKVFVHSAINDETEWYMPEWLHIYYCPFCGAFIKGKGTGEYYREDHRSAKKVKK